MYVQGTQAAITGGYKELPVILSRSVNYKVRDHMSRSHRGCKILVTSFEHWSQHLLNDYTYKMSIVLKETVFIIKVALQVIKI